MPLTTASALTGIDLHGDSYELTVVKKHSGADPDAPLALEFVTWTPVQENAVLEIPSVDAELDAAKVTLSFDVVLTETPAVRKTPVAEALATLADTAEETIRYLSSLA